MVVSDGNISATGKVKEVAALARRARLTRPNSRVKWFSDRSFNYAPLHIMHFPALSTIT